MKEALIILGCVVVVLALGVTVLALLFGMDPLRPAHRPPPKPSPPPVSRR